MGRRPEKQDRLPPNSLEAERGALACCLLDPLLSLNHCEEANVAPDWFYDLRHQVIYDALRELQKKGWVADVITLQDALKKAGRLEDVGGLEYLQTLPDAAPSASNLEYYLQILWEKLLLRQMIRAGIDMAQGAYSIEEGEKTTADQLLARVEKEVARLAEGRTQATEQRLKNIILNVIEELEDYHRGKPQLKGVIATGIEYLDKLVGGLGGRNGNYIVLSGRPGTGKTSLAMQIADYAANEHVWFEPILDASGKPVMEERNGKEMFKVERKVGIPVGIFSLEMAAEALVFRMLFQKARADMQRWRTGFGESDDIPKLIKASTGLAGRDNILVDDTARMPIEELRAKARRMFRNDGVRLFVVDYIQLMRAGRRFREDRVQELAEISAELAALAKEFFTPFIIIAQMNRDYEKDPNRKPRLSDLKDCGAIEQDADLVGFLYHPKLRDKHAEQYETSMLRVYGNDWSKFPTRQNLFVAKHRYGPMGDVQLLFQRSCTRYLDYNVWLKEHGEKDPAQGERYAAQEEENKIPLNEELGLE